MRKRNEMNDREYKGIIVQLEGMGLELEKIDYPERVIYFKKKRELSKKDFDKAYASCEKVLQMKMVVLDE